MRHLVGVLVTSLLVILPFSSTAEDPGGTARNEGAEISSNLLSNRAPSLSLTQTVSTTWGTCGTDSTITVLPGTDVSYCYEALNDGSETWWEHDLVDNRYGVLVSGFVSELGPGADMRTVNGIVNVTEDVTSTAWWTVRDQTGAISVTASDSATVLVDGQTLTCDGPAVRFESGIPSAFTVTYLGKVQWSTTADPSSCAGASSVNETGGSGETACASADTLNNPPESYGTGLYLNSVDLSGTAEALLEFRWRHRQISNSTFQVSISVDGVPYDILLFEDTTGNPGGAAGDVMTLDLWDYVGESSVAINFVYGGDDWDWYAQVDEIRLLCPLFADGFETAGMGEWSASVP